MIQVWSDRASGALVRVADNASLLREQLATRLGVAGRVEIVEHEEEPGEVPRLA
jgi:hypothetical protein